jgi:hypothetical protein
MVWARPPPAEFTAWWREVGTMKVPRSARSISASQRRSERSQRLLDGGFTRRTFLRGAAAGTGVALGAGALRGASATGLACTGEPNPIPGGFEIPDLGFFHVNLPAPGVDVSTITDFRGWVGAAEIQGMWEADGVDDGVPRFYDVDLRFMKGDVVDTGGCTSHLAFGFV